MPGTNQGSDSLVALPEVTRCGTLAVISAQCGGSAWDILWVTSAVKPDPRRACKTLQDAEAIGARQSGKLVIEVHWLT